MRAKVKKTYANPSVSLFKFDIYATKPTGNQRE